MSPALDRLGLASMSFGVSALALCRRYKLGLVLTCDIVAWWTIEWIVLLV